MVSLNGRQYMFFGGSAFTKRCSQQIFLKDLVARHESRCKIISMTLETKLSQRTIVRARLDHVRRWLDSVVKRLTPEMMEWAPVDGMRTIAAQLVEIVSIEMCTLIWLKEGRLPAESEEGELIGDQHSLENLRQKLIMARQATLDYLDSLSDEELSDELPSGKQWYGTMWLPVMARAEHFLNIAEHEFYHTGQLISYLWARGDDPYKW